MFGFGSETFWLNVVNAAFGIVTVAAILAVVVAIVAEIWSRIHGSLHRALAHWHPAAHGGASAGSRTS